MFPGDERVVEMRSVTTKQIDSVLPFLERIEDTGFTGGTWHKAPGIMSWFSEDKVVREFRRVLYANGWITPVEFRWTEWQHVASAYVASPDKVESADAVTIKKLFTTHVRKDRFCEGHLASTFEDGHIAALLRRLKDIRKTMPDTLDIEP